MKAGPNGNWDISRNEHIKIFIFVTQLRMHRTC